MQNSSNSRKPNRRANGFVQTGGLLQKNVRKASEKRGFVETRLLTHWAEIVGQETATICRPVKVSYGREGFGATLVLLTTGAWAPLVQADLPKLKDKVNAVYGYAAISRIRLTQTSATGLEVAPPIPPAKGQPQRPIDPSKMQLIHKEVSDVADNDLRSALAELGQNILTRSKG